MTTKDKESYAMLIAVFVTIICSIFIGSICTFIATKDTKTNSDEETATDAEQIKVHMRDVNYWTVVDEDTKIIYIFSTSYGIYPYLSENGKYMRFIDGEYVEVE